MAKRSDLPRGVDGESLGKRTSEPNGGNDAWQLGGRKDDDSAQYDARMAAERAARYETRHRK